MKISSLVLASALALVPASVAFADDAKKEALKKAKEEAKKKALEAAKEKSEKKADAFADKKAAAAKVDADAKAKAAEEEKQTHAKHTGLIERLEQIATATNNAELTAKVATLKEKEAKRHALAAGEG